MDLVLQIPGWSCLSNARVTLFGDVYPLPENEQVCLYLHRLSFCSIHGLSNTVHNSLDLDLQEWAHKQYVAKHHQGPSQQWGNFHYFRMQNIRFLSSVSNLATLHSD